MMQKVHEENIETIQHRLSKSSLTLRDPSRLGTCGVINRMMISVEKPHRICFDCSSIIIPVPAIVGMSSVLDVKNSMTKTGLSVS